MTVEKMIAILNHMPKNAKVYFIDTWWQGEGWGDNTEWNEVDTIYYNEEENKVELDRNL